MVEREGGNLFECKTLILVPPIRVETSILYTITGFMHQQQTAYKGKRWSTAEAYLRPAMDRDNLHVLTEALVTKVCTRF